MQLVAEERQGLVNGLKLAPSFELTVGGFIGWCACGATVSVPDDEDELVCSGCGNRWRLEIVVKVERAARGETAAGDAEK